MPDKDKDRAVCTELSINDIRASAWNASHGNPDSYKFLKEQNRKLARLANSRLRSLEKAGYDMFAYDRAITYLKNQNRTRFSIKFAPYDDYKGMVKQLSELVTFINSPTSTVAKARETMRKKIDKISEYTGNTYTDEQSHAIARLLSTDSISTLLRDVRGDSGDVIDVIEELSVSDANVDAISSTIDKYLAGYDPFGDNSDYLSYDEMMDELRNMSRG